MENEYTDLLVPIELKYTAVKFIAKIQSINLGISAVIHVRLYDNNDRAVDAKIYKLEGESYTNWGSDDAYILEYVQQQLAKE